MIAIIMIVLGALWLGLYMLTSNETFLGFANMWIISSIIVMEVGK